MKYLSLLLIFTTIAYAQTYSGGLPLPGIPKSLGQKTMAQSTSVTIASDQAAIPVSGTFSSTNPSIGTPGLNVPISATYVGFQDSTGKLASVTLTATGALPVSNASNGTIGTTAPTTANYIGVSNPSGVLVPITLTATGAVKVDGSAVSQPVNLQDGSGSPVNKGQATMAGSLPVVFASNQSTFGVTTSSVGKTIVDHIRLDYTVTNTATTSYVQVSSGLKGTCNAIDIFDSSGQTLQLRFTPLIGSATTMFVVPGGNGSLPVNASAGSVVALQAVSSTASAGEFDLNCYQ